MKQMAPKLGLTPNALYKYVEGVCHFPVDLVAPLYRETQERAVLDFILGGTDFELVEKLSDDEPGKLGRDWVVDLVDKVGKVLGSLSGLAGDFHSASEKDRFHTLCALRDLRHFLSALERALVDAGRIGGNWPAHGGALRPATSNCPDESS